MAWFSSVLAVCALSSVALASEIQVLYSPESIVLQNTSQPLQSSDYSKFVALCLAYSSEKPSNFDGFYGYKNFVNIPRSVVTFHVPVSLDSIASETFSLNDNADIENQYSVISHLMLSKYEDSFSEKMDLSGNKADISLHEQIGSLNSFLDQLYELKSQNQLPKRLALWFDFSSAAKTDELSINKFQLQLQESVTRVRTLLDDKVVVLSVVDQELHALKRSVRQAETSKDRNLAYAYAADFHVAFTTIGFTTVLLLLTVFGVSVAMWNIDPGRDSIIYRLTSQKMKKEQ